jgi:hypothetical protein
LLARGARSRVAVVDSGGKRIGRKLLVASLGVATVSYVACGRSKPLVSDAGRDVPEVADAGASDHPDAAVDAVDATDAMDARDAVDRFLVGNLA